MNTTQTERTYAIDPAHSYAEFVVRHLMIAKVRGRFSAMSGAITLADDGNIPASVEASIDTTSISTNDAQRDGHLQSPDFFDSQTFPNMTFTSTQIVASRDGFELHGDLTIHGTTRPVVLATTFEGRATDPWGNERVGFEAHGTINRTDFGLTFNQTLETGGVLVGEEVKIEIAVEAIAQK